MNRCKCFLLVICLLTGAGTMAAAAPQQAGGWKIADQSTRPIGKDAIAPRGDPDAIYQRGSPAARVSGVRISRDQSRIYFAQVSDAANLDTSAPFVFRGYMLNFRSAGSRSGSPPDVYGNMICSVRGRQR
jgi:hypothetical protein